MAIKICIFLGFLFILQTVMSYTYINYIARNQLQNDLSQLTQRIKNDLRYQNGHWDTTLYTSDPDTPNPHGSSGFIDPLYILTIDGSVIERNMPIKGLLDASDYKQFLQYQTPQTFSGITNEQWRVLAQPIVNDGVTSGVVIVSYYSPENQTHEDIDLKLKTNLAVIVKDIKPNGTDIDVSHVDVRRIAYDIAFKVVTNANKVKLSNGRTPSFIDPSYVTAELNRPGSREVKDSVTQTPYLIESLPLFDNTHNKVGLVVAGKSLQHLNVLLKSLLRLSGITLLLFLIPASYVLALIVKKEFIIFSQHLKNSPVRIPDTISFDRKNSILSLDDEALEIPYASNQYYFLEALLSQPKKRWEQDELLERFGQIEDKNSWRSIYDTMLAINKKLGFKLAKYKDKTYQINPNFVTHISVSRES